MKRNSSSSQTRHWSKSLLRKASQELQMLSSVTLNYQITIIVVNWGSQLSEVTNSLTRVPSSCENCEKNGNKWSHLSLKLTNKLSQIFWIGQNGKNINIKIVKKINSSKLIKKIKSEWVSEWVSEWQGHLLSCRLDSWKYVHVTAPFMSQVDLLKLFISGDGGERRKNDPGKDKLPRNESESKC